MRKTPAHTRQFGIHPDRTGHKNPSRIYFLSQHMQEGLILIQILFYAITRGTFISLAIAIFSFDTSLSVMIVSTRSMGQMTDR